MSVVHASTGVWRTWLRKEAKAKELWRALLWRAQWVQFRKRRMFCWLPLLLLRGSGLQLCLQLTCLTGLGWMAGLLSKCSGWEKSTSAHWLLCGKQVLSLQLHIIGDSPKRGLDCSQELGAGQPKPTDGDSSWFSNTTGTESEFVLLATWWAKKLRDELLGQGIGLNLGIQPTKKMVDLCSKELS